MSKQGTIVLVPFPFTDLSSQKLRPALIIDNLPSTTKDHVVIFITSQSSTKQSSYSYRLPKTGSGFKQTGLKTASIFRCDKIATLDKKIILGELGTLPKTHLDKIKAQLKKLFFN